MNLIDVNNIDCSKLPKKLYPYTKDILDFFDAQLPINAIPKADYEARLKADMAAMLEKLNKEINELCIDNPLSECEEDMNRGIEKAADVIQEKIDKLKEVEE